jgi:hypothetical protein
VLGLDAVGHRHEVEAVPLSGHAEELGADLRDDEAHLAVSVERQDRVLHRPQAGQRQGEHDRLDAGRELPGDAGAVADTEVVEAGGHALGAIAQLGEGDLAVLTVVEDHDVGRCRRSRLHQLPHGGGLLDGLGHAALPCSRTPHHAAHGGRAPHRRWVPDFTPWGKP